MDGEVIYLPHEKHVLSLRRDQMTTYYYVYENWRHRKVRVHVGECVYCRDGQGLHGGGNGENDRWHKVADLAEADAFKAKKLQAGWQDVDYCGFCFGH